MVDDLFALCLYLVCNISLKIFLHLWSSGILVCTFLFVVLSLPGWSVSLNIFMHMCLYEPKKCGCPDARRRIRSPTLQVVLSCWTWVLNQLFHLKSSKYHTQLHHFFSLFIILPPNVVLFLFPQLHFLKFFSLTTYTFSEKQWVPQPI